MLITDAQVHLWLPDTPDRPWPPGTHAFAHGASMSPEEMIRMMDSANVDRALLVPPSWAGDRNDYCARAARKYPQRFAVAGRVPLDVPMRAEALAAWCKQYSLLGIRLTFSRGKSKEWLNDGTADWLWAAAQEAGIPVFLYTPGLIRQVDEIAAHFPDLKITLDHLTLHTEWRDDEIISPLRELVGLAQRPNISVKASSIPSYVTEPYPFRSVHEKLHRIINAFGAQRVFWGSDVTRLPVPYEECVALFMKELDFLSQEERRLIMGEALSSWIDWPEP